MVDTGFSKKLRLLTAVDYKVVFSKASYKVSCNQFLLLAVPNGEPRPRLGLVIAKKNVAKAVQRNRIKRQLRNSFRLNQEFLTGMDIIVLARKHAEKLDNQQINHKIQLLWADLDRKRNR